MWFSLNFEMRIEQPLKSIDSMRTAAFSFVDQLLKAIIRIHFESIAWRRQSLSLAAHISQNLLASFQVLIYVLQRMLMFWKTQRSIKWKTTFFCISSIYWKIATIKTVLVSTKSFHSLSSLSNGFKRIQPFYNLSQNNHENFDTT